MPELTEALQEIFTNLCRSVLNLDPYRCFGLPNHALRGQLRGYRALEIDWEGTAYRLVYRVYEALTPRRVVVLSFAEHDRAYERAIARRGS